MNKDISYAKKALDKASKGRLVPTLVYDQDGKPIGKPPSRDLISKIEYVVRGFGKLRAQIADVFELGHKEGFSDEQIGNLIRDKAKSAGLHRNTVLPYLPSSAKAKPRGITQQPLQISTKNVQTLVEKGVIKPDIETTIKEDIDQPTQDYIDIRQSVEEDIEMFNMADRHFYKPDFLIKVGNELIRLGKEKLGQTKKYQPTPDEVKQREDKVLSLVKEGVTRISDLVEQSGVPESAVRRYLKKAGYKVFAGMLDLVG